MPMLLAKAEYQDTPLTTELWMLCSKNDPTKTDEALEGFLYSNPDLAMARSADRRGGLWWAWEFKNTFALAALKAYGADPETSEEDDEGSTPRQMCDGDECDGVLDGIDTIVKQITDRKAARELREQNELDDEDDDDDGDEDDDDDSTSVRFHGSGAKKASAKKENLDVAADEDDEDEEL